MSVYGDLAHDLADLFASDLFSDALMTRNTPTVDPRQRRAVASASTIACRAMLDTTSFRGQDGALIVATTITTNLEPHIGDTITLAGKAYRVIHVSSEAPNGVPLIYYADVER